MTQTRENALEIEQVTVRVKVVDILPGDCPAIITVEQFCTPSGKVRPFTQKVAVPDASLFERLLREVGKGEDIEAIVITAWYADDYQTSLAHFSTLENVSSMPQPAAALATAVS